MTHDSARRRLLQIALAAGMAPALSRHAGAADTERFTLGIASGHPRPDGMVLWTRLTGDDLPERVDVRWEVAEDDAFRKVVASGQEVAEGHWAHSVHAEPAGLQPARWYWYRFQALGQRSTTGRTRTAPAPDAAASLQFAIASCQRWDHGHYAAWRHMADEQLDLVLFLGDYIYEYPYVPGRVRSHTGGYTTTLSQYRDRYAQYKSDPALQAMHAAAPWLLVWDDHEVENDHAGLLGEVLEQDFVRRRAAAYQAYWEHLPFPKAWRPRGPDMRIHARWDWGTLARIHTLDDRQYRDPQVCPKPGRGGSNTVALKNCPALLDPKRTLLGEPQERWLAEGWDLQRRWNLLAQQTLMARFSWKDPAAEPTYWTDGWDGYAPARNRLLGTVRDKKVPNVVVLGGDVHSNYVADLKADFDDDKSSIVAAEFCGTSISSNSMAQSRVDAALPFNPHVHYGRSDQRGYVRFALDEQQLKARLRVVDDVLDAASGVRTAAEFVVEAGHPGVQAA
ncbi:alkaline phosphatase D family protein [Ideonella sp. BN130291]|uniref:alkaline phosphatase D family protein n=1 Tax=Ideonella sp. BN130291 TaxID=3112940 RepID=UPI002E25B5C4|nr:alkaline phosphatase D family protein [Ideonella sp. BN130291]